MNKLPATHPARRVLEFIRSTSQTPSPHHPEGWDNQFNELALELFAYQFEGNTTYRRFCELRRVLPGSFTTWSDIPTVHSAAFKEFELTCIPPGERTTVFYSSGTTGQPPSRHFHHAQSLAIYHASLIGWFRRHLLPDGMQANVAFLSLTPSPEDAPTSSLAHMFGTVLQMPGNHDAAFVGRVGNDGSWEVEARLAINFVGKHTEAHRPVILLGTAFNFVHLTDFLDANRLNLNLPPGSVVMETGGYKGRSRELPKTELHRIICDRFGLSPEQIVCEYGMSELSSQAYDLVARSIPAERRFKFPPWARLRVVSPESGREVAMGSTGLIQVFDLANAFSIMALQTEDLAVRHADGFELIGRATTAEPRGCSLASL